MTLHCTNWHKYYRIHFVFSAKGDKVYDNNNNNNKNKNRPIDIRQKKSGLAVPFLKKKSITNNNYMKNNNKNVKFIVFLRDICINITNKRSSSVIVLLSFLSTTCFIMCTCLCALLFLLLFSQQRFLLFTHLFIYLYFT